MRLGSRARATLIGTCAVLVALIATAFAVGGSGSTKNESAGVASRTYAGTVLAPGLPPTVSHGATSGSVPVPQVAAGVPLAATQNAPLAGRTLSSASGGAGTSSGDEAFSKQSASVNDASSVDATRIVKTGQLTIRVAKKDVQTKTQALTALAAAQGGYVSSSNTYLGSGSPSGEVVLRIPVANFESAIAAAEKLGVKTLSLTTSADDVTGKYVDLSAREHALQQTRSTYLSILSRARTIGATLSVQQRIDDIQQQIDQLHGQLKLLGNQSSYSTLTVDVVPAGVAATAVHHERHGIGLAWHKSWSRFSRGVDAMVGAIGPIVFAVLLLALFGAIGFFGYRGMRRVTNGTTQA